MTARTLGQNKKNLALQFIGGALVGAAAGFLMVRLGPDMDFPGVHGLGLIVAALLLVLGAIIIIASFTRSGAAQLMGEDLDPAEDIRPELRPLRWQGIVTLLAGVELVILSLSTDLLTGPRSELLLAVLIGVTAVQTWFNYQLWRRGDELFRRLIVEAAVIGFIVFQFALFFWVAGARFALVPDPSALDIYVLMLVLYLVGGSVASVRLGFGTSGG